MSAGRFMLRLLEAVCALVTLLFVALLTLASDYQHLRAAYNTGALTRTVMVFVVVCATWLVLWRKRTERRMSVRLAMLLATGACALVLVVAVAV